ncbi:MAG: hypothetical protein WA715_28325, partial [Candidatus Acidiferrum sp.]
MNVNSRNYKMKNKYKTKTGSEQEFVETGILGCLLKNDEFSFGEGHALGLEQQIAEILVTA